MAYQPINVGAAANDGNGDPLRSACQKINANFVELYDLIPTSGTGSPEGLVSGNVGRQYFDTADLNQIRMFVKSTASGLTGWILMIGNP